MGQKRKRMKQNKPAKRKKTEEKSSFIRQLRGILPVVILLIVSINTFIFYYIPSLNGISFLYNLFDSGNLIIPSSIGVIIILAFQVLITNKIEGDTLKFLSVYAFVSNAYFFGAPSFIYEMLASNKLNWTLFLIAEYLWELTAFVIIIRVIKNYKSVTIIAKKK